MRFPNSLLRVAAVFFTGLVTASGLFAQGSGPNRKAKAPNPAYAAVEDVAGLPRVLLIGDSISIGYTLATREQLKGKANVHRPATNCGPTKTGLAHLDAWLATGGAGKKWDVIHFNWGLHDLKHVGDDGSKIVDVKTPGSRRQISPEDYRANLETLVARLKATGAKLIWRNTTPVPEGAKGRVVEDVPLYNGIAAEVMKEAGIPTHDLYAFALERLPQIQLPADVHFTPAGSAVLAEDVARAIEAALRP